LVNGVIVGLPEKIASKASIFFLRIGDVFIVFVFNSPTATLKLSDMLFLGIGLPLGGFVARGGFG